MTTQLANTNICLKAYTYGSTPPTAVNDSYATAENTPLSVPEPGVLSNDTDAYDYPLTASLVSQATHGTVALNADGSFTYTPNTGFTGTDRFVYLANNGQSQFQRCHGDHPGFLALNGGFPHGIPGVAAAGQYLDHADGHPDGRHQRAIPVLAVQSGRQPGLERVESLLHHEHLHLENSYPGNYLFSVTALDGVTGTQVSYLSWYAVSGPTLTSVALFDVPRIAAAGQHRDHSDGHPDRRHQCAICILAV